MLVQSKEGTSISLGIIIILYEGRSENIWTWADISANNKVKISRTIVA
jgi:hypothetical protein